MNRLLVKVAWITRRWNIGFTLFSLMHRSNTIEIDLCSFLINLEYYSLLSFHFRLPNKTNVRRFVIDRWDIFFIYTFLYKRWESLDDKNIWNNNSMNIWDKFQLKILDKIV
jgi:hypothetical protein